MQAILENHCADCHANGAAEGRIDFILNGKRLVQRGHVIPRNGSGSKLYRLVQTGQMPKDADSLDQAQRETIKAWIDAGAPDWNPPLDRKPILPAAVLTLIVHDLAAVERRNPRDLQFIRYFTITHLYNAGYDDNELETYRLALSKLVNSLS